ncbi:MAG: HepT-like ribonuclease domain-containing protein [Chloroflexota bacterium]
MQKSPTSKDDIVHDYMNIDEDVVWQVVTNDLPVLIVALEKLDLSE